MPAIYIYTSVHGASTPRPSSISVPIKYYNDIVTTPRDCLVSVLLDHGPMLASGIGGGGLAQKKENY